MYYAVFFHCGFSYWSNALPIKHRRMEEIKEVLEKLRCYSNKKSISVIRQNSCHFLRGKKARSNLHDIFRNQLLPNRLDFKRGKDGFGCVKGNHRYRHDQCKLAASFPNIPTKLETILPFENLIYLDRDFGEYHPLI